VTGAPSAGVRETSDDEDRYFERTRPELRALVPAAARRVLDVGCGGGALGAALKAERGCEVVGLEGFPEAAERARERLDHVLCLDLESLDALPPALGRFDAIVFGDVLEHLRDPERLIRTLLPALGAEGVVVCSIPNVRHWSVVYALLVDDRWTYDDCGLLDRTHVHFFTFWEMVDMLAATGLEVMDHEVIRHVPPVNPVKPLADVAAALGGRRADAAAALAAYQYLLVARPAPASRPEAAPAPSGPAPRPAGAADLRALVPASAERVLDVELDSLPSGNETYDALVLRHVLEHARDPAALLRGLLPSLADDGVVVLAVPNVKHWSVLAPLLAHDRWANGPLRYFTLEEVSDLLDEVGLEGVEVVPNESSPVPPELASLADLAGAAGADHEETHLRLGACEYLVVARRAPLN
jgi:2-polyprenyl-3-methyl-5-hydroxy-6-metoxy-1,4-benzoquinol methylase